MELRTKLLRRSALWNYINLHHKENRLLKLLILFKVRLEHYKTVL